MALPENGSVVIIDDKPKQAFPIINALSKKGISTTYYTGIDKDELPHNPVQNIRLAFVDLQLFNLDNDPHTIATRIINILQQIIAPDNGPYLLLIWSLKKDQYGQSLIDEVKKVKNKVVPASIILLDKAQCIERKKSFEKLNDFKETFIEEMSKSFEGDDVNIIEKAIDRHWIIDEEDEYEAKPNAIKVIEQNIQAELKKAGVFHLFVIWENILKKAANETVQKVSSIINSDDNWEFNMRNLFHRLGEARVGQNNVELTDSLYTLMQTYNDNVELQIQGAEFPLHIELQKEDKLKLTEDDHDYRLGIEQGQEAIFKDDEVLFFKGNRNKLVKAINGHKDNDEKGFALKLLELYDNIPPSLNTSLHLELKPTKNHIPGNIFVRRIADKKKQEYLKKTYYKSDRKNLDDFMFIELEISPICDYAQAKWKKSRLISGIIYPADQPVNSNIGHFYYVEPNFLIDGKVCKIVFDCHLFKSLDHSQVEKRTIKYRLKRELLLDIIAKVAAHVNRPGISFVQ